MSALSFIGEPTVVLATAFFGYVSAALRGQSKIETALFYGAIAFCINILIKQLIHRARPNNLAIETFGLKSYSFPSGHAFGTIIFYGLFALLDIKYLVFPLNWIIGGFIWLIIFMIGLSRVYLKRHYPTDVLAGWLLGGISLIVIALMAF